jgi:hypothetical protein
VRVRFQADADLDEDIITGLRRREPSIDVQTALEGQLTALHDLDVLARAASQGRILVSHDLRTMPRHFADFIAKGGASPGLLIVPQRTATGAAIEELLLIWTASSEEEWLNRIVVLPL